MHTLLSDLSRLGRNTLSIWALILMGIGLSADAFAAALAIGVKKRVVNAQLVLSVGTVFAAFQAAMPVIGWLLASSFSEFVAPVDHWIAFGLLSLLGVNMIREAVSASENDSRDSGDVGFHRLCLLGLATSIDALAVGVSLAMVDTSLPQAVLVIALATLALSAAGVLIGHRAGLRFRKPAEISGGLVLIAIGFKVLLDHLGAF